MIQYLIILVVAINFFVSLSYYIRVKVEIPLFIAFFNILVIYRDIALQSGYGGWATFNYGIAFIFNKDMAETATNLITFGSTFLLYSFIIFYKPSSPAVKDSNSLLRAYLLQNKNYIIAGLIFFSFFALTLSSNISDNYGFLAKLGNASFVMLFFLIVTFTDRTKRVTRFLYFLIFLALAYISYSPTLRFQFLGWMIPVGYYLVRHLKPALKLTYLSIGLIVILILFSAAGVLRYTNTEASSSSQILDASLDRLKSADDINFIDGFVMLYQVYPRYLDYGFGVEHLNILLRPIPRTIWPDKPYGGWVLNYNAKYGNTDWAAGFSPTIYGVFYSELGIFGIAFFSVMWGVLLSYLYRSFQSFQSDLPFLLTGILLASLIPILRSGDMAGDIAIVLMTYWPLIVFVRQYKKFVRKQIAYAI